MALTLDRPPLVGLDRLRFAAVLGLDGLLLESLPDLVSVDVDVCRRHDPEAHPFAADGEDGEDEFLLRKNNLLAALPGQYQHKITSRG
jgi:hypothetical protein